MFKIHTHIHPVMAKKYNISSSGEITRQVPAWRLRQNQHPPGSTQAPELTNPSRWQISFMPDYTREAGSFHTTNVSPSNDSSYANNDAHRTALVLAARIGPNGTDGIRWVTGPRVSVDGANQILDGTRRVCPDYPGISFSGSVARKCQSILRAAG